MFRIKKISFTSLIISLVFIFVLAGCATSQQGKPAAERAESSAPGVFSEGENESVSPFEGALTIYSSDPVFQRGLERTWDQAIVDLGAVLYHDGLFHLFYNGTEYYTIDRGGSYNTTFQPSLVGYAVSANGYDWYRMADAPILIVEGMEVPTFNARVSSVVVGDDGTWMMYLYSQSNDARFPPGAILLATASAPEGPWTLKTKPVLSPGGKGTWDDFAVHFPDILKTDDGYLMYYIGIKDTGFGSAELMMGMATSNDGFSWTKYDDPTTSEGDFRESDPVFILDTELWGGTSFRPLRVLQDGNGWEMLYSASNNFFSPPQFGHARSVDGIEWLPVGDIPILTDESLDGAKALGFADMLYHDGTYYLYFNATKDDATGNIYLATSEQGE